MRFQSARKPVSVEPGGEQRGILEHQEQSDSPIGLLQSGNSPDMCCLKAVRMVENDGPMGFAELGVQ